MEEVNITIPNEKVEQENLNIPNTEIKEYPKPFVTVDNVIFSKDLRYVLLIKRGNDPYKNYLALPGGYVENNESVEDACKRELKEETNLDILNLHLSNVYSKPDRDPRGWTISIAYYTVINKKSVKAKAGDDAIGLQWIEVAKATTMELAFDHKRIILDAYQKAFNK